MVILQKTTAFLIALQGENRMNDEKTMENTVDTPVTNENVTPPVSQPAESNETAATENGAPQAGSPTAAPAIDPAAGGAPAPKKKKTPIIIAVAAVVVRLLKRRQSRRCFTRRWRMTVPPISP